MSTGSNCSLLPFFLDMGNSYWRGGRGREESGDGLLSFRHPRACEVKAQGGLIPEVGTSACRSLCLGALPRCVPFRCLQTA